MQRPQHMIVKGLRAALLLFGLLSGLALTALPAAAQGLPGKKLIDAIMDNNLAIARHEILNGTSVNQRDGDGVPAIVVAATHNRYYLINFLVENGVNVDATSEETGESAIMAAADNGHIDVIEQLIDAGADFNLEDDQGETALIKAVRKGYIRIVRTLADAGADLNHTDYTGRSALAVAEESRQRGIMRFLESRNATY